MEIIEGISLKGWLNYFLQPYFLIAYCNKVGLRLIRLFIIPETSFMNEIKSINSVIKIAIVAYQAPMPFSLPCWFLFRFTAKTITGF
tara:strand:+ start:3662 stop:3922 length:261 start_codon:yes stop_codon:yes gene_type:complete